MKRILIILIMLGFFTSSGNSTTEPHLDIYYFHATHRCPTCLKIEANARKTLETYFSEDVLNQKIIIHMLNFEEPENATLFNKFELYSSSLVLNAVDKNGKETAMNMTDFAFTNAYDEDAFIKGLKTAIDKQLSLLN
jgi:hypothetical protein